MNNNINELKKLVNRKNKLNQEIQDTMSLRQRDNVNYVAKLQKFSDNVKEYIQFCKDNNMSIEVPFEEFNLEIEGDVGRIRCTTNDFLDKFKTNDVFFVASISEEIVPDEIPTNIDINSIVDKNLFILPEFKYLCEYSDDLLSKIQKNIQNEILHEIDSLEEQLGRTFFLKIEKERKGVCAFVENMYKLLDFCNTNFKNDVSVCLEEEISDCLIEIDLRKDMICFSEYINEKDEYLSFLKIEDDGTIKCDFDLSEPSEWSIIFDKIEELKESYDAFLCSDGSIKPMVSLINKNSEEILNKLEKELNEELERERKEIKEKELEECVEQVEETRSRFSNLFR